MSQQSRMSRLSLQLVLIDLLLTPVGLALASQLRLALPFGRNLQAEAASVPWPFFLVAAVCWPVGLLLSGAYDPPRILRWYQETARVLLGGTLATILLAGVLFMTYRETSRLQFVYFYVINLGLLIGYRYALRLYFRLSGRSRGRRIRVVIAGAGDLGARVARVLRDRSRWGYDLVGFLDDDPAKRDAELEGFRVLDSIDRVAEVVEQRRVAEIWIALPARAHARLAWIVEALDRTPIRAKIVPDYFSFALVRARADIVGGIPVIGLREPLIEGTPRVVKRVFDLAVAGLMLLITGPFLLTIAIAVRLDSPGPVLFRQKRVGENGRLFEMLKFRTMVADAESRMSEVITETPGGEIVHKHKTDPRVTRVGRFLRRYSLDELPQLLNVLRGDMSMVGPRPELPWLVDRYAAWQRKRFAVPQGMTGWWQVNGRSDRPMHLSTEDDLFYVYNYSLWLDLRILLMTPGAAIRGRGAF